MGVRKVGDKRLHRVRLGGGDGLSDHSEICIVLNGRWCVPLVRDQLFGIETPNTDFLNKADCSKSNGGQRSSGYGIDTSKALLKSAIPSMS